VKYITFSMCMAVRITRSLSHGCCLDDFVGVSRVRGQFVLWKGDRRKKIGGVHEY
jgi:hypothetical protein